MSPSDPRPARQTTEDATAPEVHDHTGDCRVKDTAYDRRRLAIMAQYVRGQRLLDMGFAQQPNRNLDGRTVTGLDLEKPLTPSGYAEEVVGSVTRVDEIFAGREFDTVLAGELIEHLENPYDFLRRIRRVLPPGGRLILSTPNPIGFPTLLMEIMWSRRWFYTRGHTYYFPPRWVERMLDFSGYTLVGAHGVGLWLPRGYLPWCPRWMSYQMVYVAQPA